MLTKIYDIAYEVDAAGNVQLEQDAGFGEVSRIELHPIHVRLLAERVGILAPSSDIEADRAIARLCRQMRILHARIDQLDDRLNAAAQRGHEDLEAETIYSFATWELATEFLEELPDGISAGNSPQSGAVAAVNPPKSGAVAQAPLSAAS